MSDVVVVDAASIPVVVVDEDPVDVVVVDAAPQFVGGVVIQSPPMVKVTTDLLLTSPTFDTFTDIPSMSTTITITGTGTNRLRVKGKVSGSAVGATTSLFIRATLDTGSGPVPDGGGGFRAGVGAVQETSMDAEFLNVPAGTHTVALQARKGAAGSVEINGDTMPGEQAGTMILEELTP